MLANWRFLRCFLFLTCYEFVLFKDLRVVGERRENSNVLCFSRSMETTISFNSMLMYEEISKAADGASSITSNWAEAVRRNTLLDFKELCE